MSESSLVRELLATAQVAAAKAAAIIRADYVQPREFWLKGQGDYLTKTDLAAQEAVLEIITGRHPDHSILAEEDNRNHVVNADGSWRVPDGITWHIDPLDGTTNYTFGIPMVSTSIGVSIDGEPVAGVIVEVVTDETFAGARGLGATLNGRLLPPITPPATLQDAILQVSWNRASSRREDLQQIFRAIAFDAMTIRALGSAAIMLAYVAAGRAHLYLSLGLKPWDVAAGAAILHEVGGVFTTPAGEPWQLGDQAFITGHPGFVTEAAARIRKA